MLNWSQVVRFFFAIPTRYETAISAFYGVNPGAFDQDRGIPSTFRTNTLQELAQRIKIKRMRWGSDVLLHIPEMEASVAPAPVGESKTMNQVHSNQPGGVVVATKTRSEVSKGARCLFATRDDARATLLARIDRAS